MSVQMETDKEDLFFNVYLSRETLKIFWIFVLFSRMFITIFTDIPPLPLDIL